MYTPKHFKAHEFVPKSIYDRRGERSLELIDDRILITMDTLRENLGKPITVNNWYWGGGFSQSGLRTVEHYGTLEKYEDSLSQHKFGRGCDFRVDGMTPTMVREHIYQNKDKYPHISFVEEETPTWIHIDVRNTKAITTWGMNSGRVSIV